MKRKTQRSVVSLIAGVTALTIVAACAPGPSAEESRSEGANTEITAPVTADQIAELGDVTLRVWADAGEEAVLDALIPLYEEAYPNVTVDVALKGWDDLMGTIVNAMDSDTPPDVANGNQGFAIMGTLVKAGLLRPLEDLRSVYGLADGVPESGWEPMTWNDDGTSWGSGTLYGVGAATQPLGLFYNKSKLAALGLEPPESIQDLEAALATVHASGETPIMLGNSDQYPLGSHVLGILIDMFAAPDDINAWIAGDEGATFDTPGIRKALDTLKGWGDAGYFGTGYDGRSLDDAVDAYARGEGTFFLGGSFNGSKIAAIDPDGFGYTLLKGESGEYATTGTFGTPWIVSAKTELDLPALAFLGMLTSEDFAQNYADASRLPIADLTGVTSTGTLHQSQMEAAQALFESGDFVGYLDWATPTMQRTLGSGAQELLAGILTIDEYTDRVQSDWDSFQASRRG